jgi:hypothetical protein
LMVVVEDEARRSTISRDLIQHDHPSSLRTYSPSNTIFAVGRICTELWKFTRTRDAVGLYRVCWKVTARFWRTACCSWFTCAARVAFTFTVTITVNAQTDKYSLEMNERLDYIQDETFSSW